MIGNKCGTADQLCPFYKTFFSILMATSATLFTRIGFGFKRLSLPAFWALIRGDKIPSKGREAQCDPLDEQKDSANRLPI